ncbi:hypothetical protein GmRootV118_11650 [Variovorax sp. V118]
MHQDHRRCKRLRALHQRVAARAPEHRDARGIDRLLQRRRQGLAFSGFRGQDDEKGHGGKVWQGPGSIGHASLHPQARLLHRRGHGVTKHRFGEAAGSPCIRPGRLQAGPTPMPTAFAAGTPTPPLSVDTTAARSRRGFLHL